MAKCAIYMNPKPWKISPRPSQIDARGLQNGARSPPRRHFYKTFNSRHRKVFWPKWPTWLQFHVLRTYRRAAGCVREAESECQQRCPSALCAPCYAEHARGTICPRFCMEARNLRCAKIIAPANVSYISNEASPDRVRTSRKLENQ